MGKSRQSRSPEHQRSVEERRRSGASGPHTSTRDRKTLRREQQNELDPLFWDDELDGED